MMNIEEVFKLWGELGVRSQEAERTLNEFDRKVDRTAQDLQRKFDRVGQGFENMGQTMSRVGGNLTKTVTGPLAAIGGTAIGVAKQFDDAIRDIQRNTGAMGDDLDRLEDSFRDVYTEVPEGMQDTAAVVGDFHDALGLTDEMLERVSIKTMDLSRLVGEDLHQVTDEVIDLFRNWEVPAEDMEMHLDRLYRASLETGIEVTTLASSIRENGGALRELGIGMDESIALMANLEERGLDAEQVMDRMERAFRELAEEGHDVEGMFNETIQRMTGAETATERMEIAFDTFGRRGATMMEEAIKRGAFELDEMLDLVKDGEHDIETMTEETRTLGDELAIFRSELAESIEPVGREMIEILRDLRPEIEFLAETIVGLVDSFRRLPDSVQRGIIVLGALTAAVGPVLFVLGKIFSMIGSLVKAGKTLVGWLSKLSGAKTALAGVGSKLIGVFKAAIPILKAVGAAIAAKAAPILAIIAIIGSFIAIIWTLATNLEEVTDFFWDKLGQLRDFFANIFASIGRTISEFINDSISRIANFGNRVYDTFAEAANDVSNFVGDMADTVMSLPGKFYDGIRRAGERIREAIFDWDLPGLGDIMPDWEMPSVGDLRPNVDWFSRGSVFTGPQVIGVGEGAESEAVIPLRDDVLARIGEGISQSTRQQEGGMAAKAGHGDMNIQNLNVNVKRLMTKQDIKELRYNLQSQASEDLYNRAVRRF